MSQLNTITAYIGLGSNLAAPISQIKQAHQAIKALDNVTEVAFSSLYASPPMGSQDQPDYINAVMAISTNLTPINLLRCLQSIENQQGRVRKEHWGARTLDLDLLLYADEKINLPDLIVPHVGLSERAFVVYPLQEIAVGLHISTLGSIDKLVKNCPLDGLKKL